MSMWRMGRSFCTRTASRLSLIHIFSGALPTVEGADAADVYTLNCYKQAVEDCNGKVQYDNLFDRKFFPSGMWGIMADSMSMMLSNPDDVTEAVEYLRDNYLELYAEQNG